ncbi:hypothetical protein [Pseudosulfitobacter sp. SM2401]|uniref:hypothetical protein n=1 Tax=Pseudosulfitobacter sp. SM2401 TaxID=3350098 RepID=UPI0036F1D1ED
MTRRLKAPASGVTVRMYRQGQGDCFLLAFPRKGAGRNTPVYMLIDCGYMGGSQFTHDGEKINIRDCIEDLIGATGGFIDYVAVTHEHLDHANGFNVKKDGARMFDGIEIGHLFLAWTEDGDDAFANDLRARFNDQLVALAMAEGKLDSAGVPTGTQDTVRQLLEIEMGDANERRAFAADPTKIDGLSNKMALKFLRDTAISGPEFLRPGQAPFEIAGTDGARVYVLGPPRNEDMLLSLNPTGDEEFKFGAGFGLDGETSAFHMAMTDGQGQGTISPFANRYRVPEAQVFAQSVPAADDDTLSEIANYHARYYCEADRDEKINEWRRIDGDWLGAASKLALRLNHEVNNTSLVLAFELPETGKVLLFTGDAQRGNWMSWGDLSWGCGGDQTSAKDLLGRCVFYKCGHHGSHNATLNGTFDSPWANLSWFAQGAFAQEFVAMIPVHGDWAVTKKKWNHPLPAIDEALMKKARGRVLRNDLDRVKRPKSADGHGKLTDDEWQAFKDQSVEARLYKQYTVLDS